MKRRLVVAVLFLVLGSVSASAATCVVDRLTDTGAGAEELCDDLLTTKSAAGSARR